MDSKGEEDESILASESLITGALTGWLLIDGLGAAMHIRVAQSANEMASPTVGDDSVVAGDLAVGDTSKGKNEDRRDIGLEEERLK